MYISGMASTPASFLARVPSGLHVVIWAIFLGYILFRNRKRLAEGLKFSIPVACILALAFLAAFASWKLSAALSVGADLPIVQVLISVAVAGVAAKILDWVIPLAWNSMSAWHKR